MKNDYKEPSKMNNLPSYLVSRSDAIDFVSKLPTSSVDLIVVDPPYFRMKKCWWDHQWDTREGFLSWLDKLLNQFLRVLKRGGSLYVFASAKMAASVEWEIAKTFDVLSHIVWTKPNDPGFDGWKMKCSKESLRAWYGSTERIIFAEQKNAMGFLREARVAAGLSTIDVAAALGAHGKVNHGGAVSNWEKGLNLPNEAQYAKLSKLYRCALPNYETVTRPFSVTKDTEWSDVWYFKSVRPYKGKHPCEKPSDMIAHIIRASSRPGDTVLDCFVGSGVVAEEALKQGRCFVGCDIEQEWVDASLRRISR